MKTWVVPVAVTLAYCHAAECPGGSCATPRASLLQLKSLSQKTETLATGSGSSTSAALAGFQKFTDEMIAKYGSDADTITANSTELEAVNIIYNFLDEMLSTFQVSHLDAKQKGDECYSFAYHTHCPFDWDTYESFHGQWKTAQKDHYECRRDAKVGCGEGPRHCDHYDMYRKFDDRAKMPNCIKDGVFGDAWFTDQENDLLDNGHGSCNRDSQGNAQPGGWTQGNPLAQCDSRVTTWESSSSNAGQDGAQEFDVPDLLREGSPVKWSEATYEESVAACRAKGFSTDSGDFYDQCTTAESLVGDAWEKLKCGTQNPMAAGILDGSTPVNTHTWSKRAISGWTAEDNWQGVGGFDMVATVADWMSEGTTRPSVANPNLCTCGSDGCITHEYYGDTYCLKDVDGAMTDTVDDTTWKSPLEKCQAEWGTSNLCTADWENGIAAPSNSMPFKKWSDSTGYDLLNFGGIGGTTIGAVFDADVSALSSLSGIDDHAVLIYTYGERGQEEPWAHVDECRTTVEAEILNAGNTVNWVSETEWNSMRGADYSTANAATKLLIKTALERMTDKLTCGDSSGSVSDGTFHDTATILASDISTCVGGSSDCSQCLCAKRTTWKKFPAYCPEVSPRKTDYNTDPTSTGNCQYSGKVDLLETVYPFMEGGLDQCTAQGGLQSGYYYVNPASGWHKLLKFEQCLDVTFDWLYGEKEVTEAKHVEYVDKFGASTVTTVQHNSGETLLQELYAEQIRRVGDDTEKYYAKLNGKWTGTSDARLGAFSASDVITRTKAYSQEVAACNSPGGSSMRWTRKPGWHKSELRYVAWMEPDGQRTSWGLWQHYVKCELAESHRAAELFAKKDDQDPGTFWTVKDKTTKSYWERVGENVRTSSSESRTWNNASSSSHYSHTSLEAHKTISERTHCVWIDGTCHDQWHIRCLDYYYMCAALQQRAEAAYLEWRFFRENECDAQEICLTNGPDLACNAAYSAADDAKKKDSQMYKCSETCAIEHENAKAREADIETAERLRCMLEALFGKPDSSATIEKTGAGAADVNADCEHATCKDNLSCKNNVCVALDQVWTLPAGNARSTALAACNDKTYDLKYWNLKQEECPSWAANCAGVATRTYWSDSPVETNDAYAVWSGGADTLDASASWTKSVGKKRNNCGTKDSSTAGGLCTSECTDKQSKYAAVASAAAGTASTEFWASWSTIYATCKDEHFLTTGLWNTHDVCHLTVFDHDNTEEQITEPRWRQTESATSASSTSTYVASCYGNSCAGDNSDEYSVASTTWGKFAFDFCDGGALDLNSRNSKDAGISQGRKALHVLGWNNLAATNSAPEIFSYAWHSSNNVALKTWSLYSDSTAKDPDDSAEVRPVLCTDDQLDESWTPNTGCGAFCQAYDGLTALSKADCWRERAKHYVVDDEFGPAHCKISA